MAMAYTVSSFRVNEILHLIHQGAPPYHMLLMQYIHVLKCYFAKNVPAQNPIFTPGPDIPIIYMTHLLSPVTFLARGKMQTADLT